VGKVTTDPLGPRGNREEDITRRRDCASAKHSRPLNVVWGDGLGEGQYEGERPRHADLVDVNEGIGCNNGTRAEVDALAHKVAADAAFLALKALADRLDGLAAALLRLWATQEGRG